MARFTIETAENFKPQQSSGGFTRVPFLGLKNDNDSTRVRFLLESVNDVPGFKYHPIEQTSQNGKNYTVNVDCLDFDGHHKDSCALCQASHGTKTSLFIPVINYTPRVYKTGELIDEPQYEIWERYANFYSVIAEFCQRFTKPGLSWQVIADIVRHGSKDYRIYPVFNIEKGCYDDDLDLEALKQKYNVVPVDKARIKEMSNHAMTNYLQTGKLTFDEKPKQAPNDPQQNNAVRNNNVSFNNQQGSENTYVRRTPSAQPTQPFNVDEECPF